MGNEILAGINPAIQMMVMTNSGTLHSGGSGDVSISYMQLYVLIGLSVLFTGAIVSLFWSDANWFWRIAGTIFTGIMSFMITFLMGILFIELFNTVNLH